MARCWQTRQALGLVGSLVILAALLGNVGGSDVENEGISMTGPLEWSRCPKHANMPESLGIANDLSSPIFQVLFRLCLYGHAGMASSELRPHRSTCHA